VQSQTRFFAAADAVSLALADVATPVSGLLVSGQTASFLEGMGQKLETLNQTESGQIQAGGLLPLATAGAAEEGDFGTVGDALNFCAGRI
jgi:hypothetical protein